MRLFERIMKARELSLVLFMNTYACNPLPPLTIQASKLHTTFIAQVAVRSTQ